MPKDLRWAIVTLLWILLSVPLVTTRADPDLWGHTRFGLDILETWTLPEVDPYSFTQDRPWVNHEWLSELLMGIAYSWAGPAGLIFLKAAVIAAGYGILVVAFRNVHPLVAAGSVLLAAWGGLLLMLTVRPQIWTFLGLVVVVRLLDRSPLLLPLVFAVWVNLHGGWIVGLGVVGTWCGVSALQHRRERREALKLLAVPVLCLVATLLNPYGAGMWRFLAETVRPGRDISEWQPLSSYPALAVVPFVLIGALAVALSIPRRSRPSAPRLAVLLLLAVASIQVSRISLLAAPVALLILAPSLEAWWPASSWRWRAPSRSAASLTALPILLVAAAALPVHARAVSCIRVVGTWLPDPGAIASLKMSGATGTVVTPFGWGQYALWHLSPALRVSLDGRRETVYSDAVLDVHDAIFEGGAHGDEWLSRQRPDYVLLPAKATARRDWLLARGYRLDRATGESYLLTRADHPRVPDAQVVDDCFPHAYRR